MATTFVYNTGEPQKAAEDLHLTFGLFFDGTLNNRENSRLRKKFRNEGRESITDEENNHKIKLEEAHYTLINSENPKLRQRYIDQINNNPNQGPEYLKYLEASHRSESDKKGMDNSFSNDYTNVARQWFCCDKNNYGIYIEGIGTLDNTRDVDGGFQYGSGITGIRSKVKKGCEDLAEKVELAIKAKPNDPLKSITVDVFGFSRGAAAARNFVHELNRIKAEKPKQNFEQDYTTTSPSMGTYGGPTSSYKAVDVNNYNEPVDMSVAVNGKLPTMGHFGYTLVKQNILTNEELENIRINIRFVGVYDTVSSYEEIGDMDTRTKLGTAKAGAHGAAHVATNYFDDDIKQLNLDDLGSINKAVHFTAENEHRENFSLTRVKMVNAIEKNLPGVHCDIGGAYETGLEVVDEIEVVNKHPGVGFNFYSSWNPMKKLEDFKEKLIREYWYKDKELVIDKETYIYGVIQYHKLTGTRFLKKEYSYIPLHFMERFCYPLMKKNIIKCVDEDYVVLNDEVLTAAKDRLARYVFEDGNPLKYKTEEEMKKDNAKRIQQEELAKELEEMKAKPFSKPIVSVQDNIKSPIDSRYHEMHIPIATSALPNKSEEDGIAYHKDLEEVEITAYGDQGLLRKLRNGYFHWSANRDWLGMDPENSRKRTEY
ncbi:phospholipase effector Tle1 domain-containing protein [Flavobacterium sp. '19STA2R22 D10 B1']|uniref:phospholipase effector Tle1 domain-containing protein n=1 Tax=Flavobacterium aerium TaxID=3037261 RepID=UPI00278BFE75|nr:DUF2235 domain-containing protein [Flavobacterium sp. '19STA2R22 D10 B1']